MTAEDPPFPRRPERIMVALDEAPTSERVLAFACRLAAATGARLTGLFVEDSQLLELAGSGLARELGSYSGAARSLSASGLERALETQAGAVQQRLQEAARRAGVRWSFRMLRGPIHRELLSASGPEDLLILGRGRRRRGLGAAVRRLVEEGRGSILVLGPELTPESRSVVVQAATEDAEPAILAAADLAATLGGALEVLLPAGGELREPRLRELLAGRRLALHVRTLARLDVDAIFSEHGPRDADLLVLPPGEPFDRREVRLAVLARARGPVLLLG
ncbi:MAG TPA: universal stress protein [Thermoanaerobaculia bacterium]|nr:universal stress protein [Thermoanaerobaculia bacterium]